MRQWATVVQKYSPCAQSLSLQSAPRTKKGRTAIVMGSISPSLGSIDPRQSLKADFSLPRTCRGWGVWWASTPKAKCAKEVHLVMIGITERVSEVSASKFPFILGKSWEKQKLLPSPGWRGRGRERFLESEELQLWGRGGGLSKIL